MSSLPVTNPVYPVSLRVRGVATGFGTLPAMSNRVRAAGLALGLVVVAGCATKQRVALDCVPNDVSVFVDGRELRDSRDGVELRADRAHTVYFKGGGYEPQMVVLEPREVDGTNSLEPADLCSRTDFVPMAPAVEMRAEEPEG